MISQAHIALAHRPLRFPFTSRGKNVVLIYIGRYLIGYNQF